MNAGVPIVATRVGGVRDVVSQSHAILVEAEQPGMVAQALSEIERDPSAAADRSCARTRKIAPVASTVTRLAPSTRFMQSADSTILGLLYASNPT
jgi:glycosyltransferase involved in cell wall biosynthesis